MRGKFDSLPADVLHAIFARLGVLDSARLASVCKATRDVFAARDLVASFGKGTPRSVADFLVAHADRVKKAKSVGRTSSFAIASVVGNFRFLEHLHLSATQIPDGVAKDISGLECLKTLCLRKLVPEHRNRKSGLCVFRTSWLDGAASLAHVRLFFAGSYDEIILDHEREFETLALDAPNASVEIEDARTPPRATLSISAREISTREGRLALAPITKLRSSAHARRNPLLEFEPGSLARAISLTYACAKHPFVPDLGKMTGLERLIVDVDSVAFRLHEFEKLGGLKHLTVRTKGPIYLADPGNFAGFERGKTRVSASSRNADFSDDFYAPLTIDEDFW
jgi:hypothetical protein